MVLRVRSSNFKNLLITATLHTMAITTEEIKALRDETGVSIMQCKKALEEAGGDMEKARMILRKNSATAASKKSERTLERRNRRFLRAR
jgi:DNA-binding transcriptional MerR regulator